MRHRTRRRLLRIIVIASALIVALASSEFAARLWLVTHPKPDSLPADFAAEKHVIDYSNRLTDNGYWIVDDFDGKYFKVKDGIRYTVNQPNVSRTVWLFGNSAMFGLTVGTGQTIADYLQSQARDYKVVNLGMIAADATLQTIRLKQTNIRPGDIVVFMDGNVDAIDVINASNRLYSPVCRNYNQLALVELSCSWLDTRFSPAIDIGTVQDTVSRYAHAVQQARAYALSNDATFYHFFTPDFAGAPANIIDTANETDPEYTSTQEMMYAKLRVADPQVIDLGNILDGDYWSDTSHPNAAGNAIVARAIYGAVWRVF